MKMYLITLFVCLFLMAVQGTVGIPGGASPVDVKDEKIQEAVKYAISESFPDTPNAPMYVLSATSQVVNGIIYGIVTEVNRSKCSVIEYKVLERFTKGASEGFMLLHSDIKEGFACSHF